MVDQAAWFFVCRDDHGLLCDIEIKTTMHQNSDTDFK